MRNYAADLAKDLFGGDAGKSEQSITGILSKYVSIRDLATNSPQENFYQGLMLGTLANASVEIDEMHSNMEAGDGYADLKLSAQNGTLVAIELKQIADKKASRTAAAERAIKQIADKRYAESEINNRDIKRIYAIGICFCRKYCSVVCERLK